MTPRDSLRRRIAAAFLLFALGSSLFLALIAAVAVEGIEQHLVDDRLTEVAAWAAPRHAAGLPVAMPAGLSFHHGSAIPLAMRDLPPGSREIHVDGVGLHVLSARDARGPYVVVDHQSDYEKVELVVYSLFALAFVGMLVFSLFLGGFIGRRFVSPITTLAAAVRDGSDHLPLLERKDELGLLARAFSKRTAELGSVLQRERFFTGDVSHELRTPLTVILGAAEILAEQGQHDAAVAAPAARILRAANEAADCVTVLLMLARTPDLLPHPATDVAAIVKTEIARYQYLLAAKPVELHFEESVSFSVFAPPELCAAAIGNLIRNACQYTASGRVVVRLGARSVRVEDSGPGLPPAVLAVLNGADVAEAGRASGSGLGLALVKRICAYLGATLTPTEHANGGSVLEISFGRL